jgi:hypothetical protein
VKVSFAGRNRVGIITIFYHFWHKNDAIGKILFIYLALDHQGLNGANQHFKPKFSTDAEKYRLDSEQGGS